MPGGSFPFQGIRKVASAQAYLLQDESNKQGAIVKKEALAVNTRTGCHGWWRRYTAVPWSHSGGSASGTPSCSLIMTDLLVGTCSMFGCTGTTRWGQVLEAHWGFRALWKGLELRRILLEISACLLCVREPPPESFSSTCTSGGTLPYISVWK